MKIKINFQAKLLLITLLTVSLQLLTSNVFSQNVGINETGSVPDESAVLDINSTQHGILVPRMTTAERDAIKTPATGLIIYNTSTNTVNIYNNTGWHIFESISVGSTTGSVAPGGGVAINEDGSAPSDCAILEIKSSIRGFLPPRTNTASLPTLSQGLIIYNTSTNELTYYDGSSWKIPCVSFVSSTTGSGTLSPAGVSINITGDVSDQSAMLDVQSTDKGLLIPRLTDAQRNELSPVQGLLFYNTTTNKLNYWDSTTWQEIQNSVPSTPGPISGVNTVCSGQTGITYTISGVDGATSYTWTVPSGSSITSGQGTTSITVDFAVSSGDICVTADNGCGSSPQSCINITVNTVPTSVTASVSPNPICEGNNLTLTGGATGATSWSWTGPNGYTSSSQSPTITGITTAGAGVYTLTASNTCGSASAVNTASVTVTPNNTITLTSAAETNNQITCINTAITNITYSTTGATGATFSGLPAGVTGSWAANVVTISGTPTASGTFNYTVTLTGGCGTVTATGTITVNAAPTTANAGSDINPACDATTATLAGNTPTIGTGTWSVVSGTATITTPSSPTSGVTGLTVPGTATLRWTISNSPCTSSTDDVVITTTTCFTCGTSTVSFTYNGSSVTYGTVANNGKCWLDRNLGASQVAISSTDANAYGDLFQWGRGADGHQIRTSGTTVINSPTDNPGHSNFITEGSSPYDWRVPQNNNLWQGVSGTNNPCPSGWRLPTQAEWEAEKGSWSSQNAAGAFASPLKLPVAGNRFVSDGSLYNVGSTGYYWSSTIDGTNSRDLRFSSSNAYMSSVSRAYGFSVRCIKD